jgi:phosphonate transport system substrate-binding protein
MVKHVFQSLFFIFVLLLAACGNNDSTSEQNGGPAEGNDNAEESQEVEKLVVGVIPTMSEGKLKEPMEKLAAHLEENVGIPVEIDTYPDYQGVVQAMEYGDVNLAYYGPLTYVIANHQSGAEAIITQLIDGEPFYYSYMITHKDSPVESIEDVVSNSNDLTFAFGDPSSTSGSLIPSIELKEQGVYTDPNEHQFENVIFTGGHDATALAVGHQQVDVGAIDSAIFNMIKEKGVVDGDNFKVIWKSDKLFQYPWAVTPDIDDEMRQKIKDAFLSVEDQDIFDAFGASGFTEATDEDYEAIKKAAIEEGRIK